MDTSVKFRCTVKDDLPILKNAVKTFMQKLTYPDCYSMLIEDRSITVFLIADRDLLHFREALNEFNDLIIYINDNYQL